MGAPEDGGVKRLPQNLPEKIVEKYGLDGIVLLAVSKNGVECSAVGNMTVKTAQSLMHAVDEYKRLVVQGLEKKFGKKKA